MNLQKARDAGYTDEQIAARLSEAFPGANIGLAMEKGYSLDDVVTRLSTQQPVAKPAPVAQPAMTDAGIAQPTIPETSAPLGDPTAITEARKRDITPPEIRTKYYDPETGGYTKEYPTLEMPEVEVRPEKKPEIDITETVARGLAQPLQTAASMPGYVADIGQSIAEKVIPKVQQVMGGIDDETKTNVERFNADNFTSMQ